MDRNSAGIKQFIIYNGSRRECDNCLKGYKPVSKLYGRALELKIENKMKERGGIRWLLGRAAVCGQSAHVEATDGKKGS